MNDTILFMTAYLEDNLKFKKNLLKHKNDKSIQELMKNHHISFLAVGNNIISIYNKAKIKSEFSYSTQVTNMSVDIKEGEMTLEFNEYIKYYINLLHNESIFFDKRYFNIQLSFVIEPFTVWINENKYDIKSKCFMINSVLLITFEIFNVKTGQPLSKDDIGIKSKDYNILEIEKYKFKNSLMIVKEKIKISDLIYKTFINFSSEAFDKILYSEGYSFVHSTLIFTNNINDIKKYYCNIFSVRKSPSPIEDISTTDMYKYYPGESFSIISNFKNESFLSIFYIPILLESLKLYIYIFQIHNIEYEKHLDKITKNSIYLQNIFYSLKVPIIVYNLLNFVQKSNPYKNNFEAMNLKINYLKLQNEADKNKNIMRLNILIYILTYLGAVGSLELFENKLRIPFVYSFPITTIIFLILGIYSIIKSNK